ncbi:MAG: hypothetical protein Q7R85_02525 [bacterium]|nr:hypothetical protein [bacterium]
MPEKFEQPHKESPFREPLRTSDISPEWRGEDDREPLREFGARKDKIVRSVTLKELALAYDSKDPISDAKHLFDELKMKYGIDFSADFAVGKNEKGEPSFFVVADRIEGRDPLHAQVEGEERWHLYEALHKLFSSLIDYIQAKYESGDAFFWDIAKIDQYVYGTKAGESEKCLHLVDLDAEIVDVSGEVGGDLGWGRGENVSKFLDDLVQFINQSSFVVGKDFSDIKQKLRNFYDGVPDKHIREHFGTFDI